MEKLIAVRIGVFAGIVFLMCISLMQGCVSIPVGKEILDTKRIGSKHKTEKKLRGAVLAIDKQEHNGSLIAKLEGKYEVQN